MEAKAGEGTLLLPLNLLEKHQFGLLQQCFEVQESNFNEVRKAQLVGLPGSCCQVYWAKAERKKYNTIAKVSSIACLCIVLALVALLEEKTTETELKGTERATETRPVESYQHVEK